jgi:hypothetical protein
MDYIVKTYGKEVESYPPEVKNFWWELLEDWQGLGENSCGLLNKLFDR